jgi:hypothetical protein
VGVSDDDRNGNAVERPRRASTGLYVRAQAGLRLRDKKVERLARKMRQVMPWLEPSDWPTCRAWAELEFLAGQVYAALRGFGVLNRAGEARRLLDDYRKLRQAQVIFARELGMTPQARMQLKANGTRAALDIAESVSERAVKIAEERAEVVEETGNAMPAEVVEDGTDNCDQSDQSPEDE